MYTNRQVLKDITMGLAFSLVAGAALAFLAIALMIAYTAKVHGQTPTTSFTTAAAPELPERWTELSIPDTVGQGDNFWVQVVLGESTDSTWVKITASAPGVQLPDEVLIKNGTGGFWANTQDYTGELTLTLQDSSGVIDSFTTYIAPVFPQPPGPVTAVDYLGPDSSGDQGGFVLLTFRKSVDHDRITHYVIKREVMARYGMSITGIDWLYSQFVPWGSVKAVPTADSTLRVLVATLDAYATPWGVEAAYQPPVRSEQDPAGTIRPYELMARTMKQGALDHDPNAPIFASLSLEALAFDARGVLPRLHRKTDIQSSWLVFNHEPVRAVDNLAPEPVDSVSATNAEDRITVQWTLSRDDRMLTTVVLNGLGGSSYTSGVHGYRIYRSQDHLEWVRIGSVGPGITAFMDSTAAAGVAYRYRVQPFDADNEAVAIAEARAKTEKLPAAFALANNYPNPFNPVTTLSYEIPEAAHVTLTIYDAVGQLVRTLVAEPQNPGHYTVPWDGRNHVGGKVGSGIYFYGLRAGEFRSVKKMLLLQ